jgi:hypothetical protein
VSYLAAAPDEDSATPPAAMPGELAEARARYRSFHGFAARRTETAALPRPPRVLTALGELRGVIYRSERGQPGRPRDFVHFFQSPPRLLCDPAGHQLYIQGGRYRVTQLGLEG